MKISNRLTRLIREKKPAVGMWINLCDPGVAQIAGVVGYDWVLIDNEHNPLTESQVLGLVHALSGYDVQTIVRARSNRQEQVTWLLDSGVGGVIIPGVLDAADAQHAVELCKYHPMGKRGYGPNRASGFFTNEAEYTQSANEDILLICQIELASAVREIDKICKIDGIDGIWIGPGDLAQSMGFLRNPKHSEVQAAINKVIETANRYGIPWGIPTARLEDYEHYVNLGGTLMILGSDTRMMRSIATEFVEDARQLSDRKSRSKEMEKKKFGKHIFEEINNHIYLNVWQERDAWDLMEYICKEIGPHPAGSPAMAQARDYLKTRLKGIGSKNIHEEEFPVRLWNPGTPALELLEPENKVFDCVQYLYTAPSDLSLPLIVLGSDTPKDGGHLGSQIQGTALLMDGFAITGGKFVPLITRVMQAYEAGAKALIFRNMEPIDLPALEVPDFRGDADVPIPCIGVSGKTADELVKAASSGTARIRIKTNGSASPSVCSNLIADLGPDNLPKETIILSAHLDSFWNSPGALDNLTGVVTMYEIARLLAPFRNSFRRKLRIIAFTAEELGFQGSKAYVSRHKEELDDIRFVINLDSLFPATARGMAVMWSPEMRDYINHAFTKANRQVDVRNFYCSSSDYLPFMLEGVPTSRPADWENSFPTGSHTAKDDLSNVRVDWINLNAMVYAQLLAQMLIDPAPLPAHRLTKDEVWEKVLKEDVADDLKLLGFDLKK